MAESSENAGVEITDYFAFYDFLKDCKIDAPIICKDTAKINYLIYDCIEQKISLCNRLKVNILKTS